MLTQQQGFNRMGHRPSRTFQAFSWPSGNTTCSSSRSAQTSWDLCTWCPL